MLFMSHMDIKDYTYTIAYDGKGFVIEFLYTLDFFRARDITQSPTNWQLG